jgi:hypothetical protein
MEEGPWSQDLTQLGEGIGKDTWVAVKRQVRSSHQGRERKT